MARGISETQFAREYEDLLVRFGTDYESVRNALPVKQDMENFFGSGPSSPVAEPQFLFFGQSSDFHSKRMPRRAAINLFPSEYFRPV
jgi:hypothetical protein